MLRAVYLKQILWPQRQEDRNEGGWQEGDERMRSEDRRRETLYRRASMHGSWKHKERAVNNRELSHDRADYAIKETNRMQTRGRTA